MKKALIAMLLLAGCSSPPAQGEKMSESDFENKIASSISFDPLLIKVGERVVYFVKRTGDLQTQTYSWSAVAEEGGAIWIENKVPFDPRGMIVKTKLERSGKMLEQWVGEPGGKPGQTYPTLHPTDAPTHVRDSGSAKADSKEEPDKIVVGGKPYDCTRVTTVLTYPDGRKSTMINWFSRDVPFAASKALGGLVKRQFGRLTMEIAGDSKNARPELQIPLPEKK